MLEWKVVSRLFSWFSCASCAWFQSPSCDTIKSSSCLSLGFIHSRVDVDSDEISDFYIAKQFCFLFEEVYRQSSFELSVSLFLQYDSLFL